MGLSFAATPFFFFFIHLYLRKSMSYSKFSLVLLFWISALLLMAAPAYSQQLAIPRIEEMPNMPQPYLMRNWRDVAIAYDQLVYDLDATGQYLPLTGLYSNTTNYPEHGSFYQQTYVGQTLGHNEAINSMMGIIGASLCGIDKSDQNGHNWVEMAEEFFNSANGQNVYGNNVGAKTGHDWWYETIPNVLFYQLYSLYPDVAHLSDQFLIVADRWLDAVSGLGGSDTPWKKPYMNYRAYNLETGEPLTTGVPEPEAAGALAWIFYNAYTQSRIEKYRIAAELCMEFFSEREENPVYELQYLYGAMAAARMNAELGTDYDLEKIMNWCFDVGPLRVWAHTTGWGVTVGTWNGLDVCGLRGAISTPGNTTFGDYAFLMNSLQQAGILTPLVRYDDRYARAMGKYLLNMANSSRLFYSNYLPPENQDGAEWSNLYDPDSYIAYEAVRRYQDELSPFATGDAMKGGWAPTNHSLYSSSPVGYLGSILETSNIEGILIFDLLKTDFFHDTAYPSYLIYNPHSTAQDVKMNVGDEMVDIYDAVSNTLLTQAVSGEISLNIDQDQAFVLVLIPAGASIHQEGNTMVCKDIVIDYIPENMVAKPLRMKALAAEDSIITIITENVQLYCTAINPSSGPITYSWFIKGVETGDESSTLSWISPQTTGDNWIVCNISNMQGESITDSVKIEVVEFIVHPPVISRISLDPSRVNPGDTAQLTCNASDPDGEDLTYFWSSDEGTFTTATSAVSIWNAPSVPGEYTIFCEVKDKQNGVDIDSLLVRVIDQSGYLPGTLVAHYPFNNNVDDYSGNNNHGIKHNVTYVSNRDGAYRFNGTNSNVEVPSADALNCNDAISVVFWMKATTLFDRETYPVSHGLWHERWKVSVTENKIRWTVRTVDDGSVNISDLDSKTKIEKDHWYQITSTYDGEYSELYINAGFEGFMHQNGSIENTDIAMTIGQASPSSTANNFAGILDEFRIYDYALSHQDIKEAYEKELPLIIAGQESAQMKIDIYPNPFSGLVNISYVLLYETKVRIEIFDILSRKVKTIFTGYQVPGSYAFTWDGSGNTGTASGRGIYFCSIITKEGILSRKIIYN